MIWSYRRFFFALVVVFLGSISATIPSGARAEDSAPKLLPLGDDLSELRAAFEEHREKLRVLILASPS